ncbi:MAG TPA: hypothetical protein VNV42_00690 [Solirubrobacteraceae bacterium]|nr:hypothetical protein [Solirubrobacteraceae bacterium]
MPLKLKVAGSIPARPIVRIPFKQAKNPDFASEVGVGLGKMGTSRGYQTTGSGSRNVVEQPASGYFERFRQGHDREEARSAYAALHHIVKLEAQRQDGTCSGLSPAHDVAHTVY